METKMKLNQRTGFVLIKKKINLDNNNIDSSVELTDSVTNYKGQANAKAEDQGNQEAFKQSPPGPA